MIVVVGGAQQPGSELVSTLNAENFNDLVIVLDHKNEENDEQLSGKRYSKKIRYKELSRFIGVNQLHVQFVVVTSNEGFLQAEEIWKSCIQWGIPLIVTTSGNTAFDTLAQNSELQPYYWSIIKYDAKDSAELPMAILKRMKDRKQSGIVELALV